MIRAAAFVLLTLTVGIALQGARAEERDPYLLQRGDEALAASRWSDAEEAYREALEADPRLLPARFGLARALLGAERRKEGIDELRRAVRWAEALEQHPESWRAVFQEARVLLGTLDPVSDALEELLRGGAKDLLKFAKSKRRKSPAEADCACRLATRLDRGNVRAAEILDEMKSLPCGEWVDVFGGSLAGWSGAQPPTWTVTDDGMLKCEAGKKAYSCATDLSVQGDFDMRVEIRIVKKNGALYGALLQGAWEALYDSMKWGIIQGQIYLKDVRGLDLDRPDRYHEKPEKIKPPIDPEAFNVFELRFRGDEVHGYINGVHYLTTGRGTHRHQGRLGLHCASATVEFKRMEIRQR